MKKSILLISAIPLIFLSACKSEANTEPLQNRGGAIISNGTVTNYNRESPYINENHVESKKQDTTSEKRAKKIAASITKIKYVDKASVILNSNSVIVGLEINGELDDAKLIKLKHEVEEEVRAVDSDVQRVAVTASKELVERITKMADFVGINDSDAAPPPLNSETAEIIQILTPPV